MSMTKTFMLAQAFEELVQRIYEANGYTTIERPTLGRDKGYDLLLRSPIEETVAVEIKVGRSRVVPRAEVIRMLDQLHRSISSLEADRGILVLAGSIGIPIYHSPNVEIVDLPKLAELTASHPRLASEFASILRELSPMPISDSDAASYRVFGDAHMGTLPPPPPGPAIPRGQQIGHELKSVPAGKKGARQFEERCLTALQYIFENDFSNWSKQKVTDGGISRYDVIARISSEHDFWKSIVVYFRSWYVVFEFKNYAQRISQGQIYTTEKYLFAGAKRMVAGVISRKGPDKNALAVSRGAARESGKLIIHLTMDDILKMLEMKDNSDDPNALLFDYLDEMLMKLER